MNNTLLAFLELVSLAKKIQAKQNQFLKTNSFGKSPLRKVLQMASFLGNQQMRRKLFIKNGTEKNQLLKHLSTKIMKSGNEENCRRTGVQYSRYNFQTQQNEYTTYFVVSFFENFKRLKEHKHRNA